MFHTERPIAQQLKKRIGLMPARVGNPCFASYDSEHFRATVWFSGVWSVRSKDPDSSFALQGDSGSLVVTEDGEQAVGIVFAVSGRGDVAFIVPMESAAKAFGGIQLIDKHGV